MVIFEFNLSFVVRSSSKWFNFNNVFDLVVVLIAVVGIVVVADWVINDGELKCIGKFGTIILGKAVVVKNCCWLDLIVPNGLPGILDKWLEFVDCLIGILCKLGCLFESIDWLKPNGLFKLLPFILLVKLPVK